ncbi:MAG: nucleotidyltransferase family protein [Gemmatimonadales bacterium]
MRFATGEVASTIDPDGASVGGGRIGVVVLAAGASRRLPGPKQMLRFRGVTLLRHAAQTAVAAGSGPVVVVLGAASTAKQLRFELVDLDVRIAENARWKEGMSSSIRAGLDALEQAEATEAVLIMTCDQPHVTADLLKQLVATYREKRPAAVACAYAGTVGVPALFDRSLFAELHALEHDQGAKRILERHLHVIGRIPFEQGAVDIDTPEDVGKLSGEH